MHHHHDATPPCLITILHQFDELFPLSRHGPMQLVLIDHAMDETFLGSLLAEMKRTRKTYEDSETSRLYYRVQCALLEFLLALPEELRLGIGRWAPIPSPASWVAGECRAPAGEGEEGDEGVGEEGEPEHPDDQLPPPSEPPME
jgi:hypothetical protein